MGPTAAVGQLLSFDDSGKQPSERLLYFASCQRVNAQLGQSGSWRYPARKAGREPPADAPRCAACQLRYYNRSSRTT